MTTDFLPPSKEIIEQVREEFGLDGRRIKEAVDMLKDWLFLQPHLQKVGGKCAAVEYFTFCEAFLHIHDYLHAYMTSLFTNDSASKIALAYYPTVV
jgi:hypothetical protein